MRLLQHVLLITCCLLFTCVDAQVKKAQAYQFAEQVMRQLQAEQFDSIVPHFDSTLSSRLDVARLRSTWETLNAQFGEFEQAEQPNIDTTPGHYLSQTILKFHRTRLAFNLTLNERFQIAGIFFQPQYGYAPASYVNTLAFTEYRLHFGKAPYAMWGMLSMPAGVKQPPCVIIVGGSGPTDMDMTLESNKPYKDIAWGLASKGVAVFRFHKRSFLYGPQLAQDAYSGQKMTIKEEYLDDVKDVVNLLKKDKRINTKKIFILGHSQGGMLAPLIAQQNPAVAGVIMAEANARPMQDLLIEQIDFLYKDQELTAVQREKTDALKRHALNAKRPDLTLNEPNDSLPGAPAAYWISVNSYNQLEVTKKIKQPVMIVQGERDYQVTMKEYALWQSGLAARKGMTTYKLYPKLNHLLMEGEGPSSPQEYSKRGNVPEYVIDDLAGWIKNIP